MYIDFDVGPYKFQDKCNTPCWLWYSQRCGTPIDGEDWDEGWKCSECNARLPDSYALEYPPDFKYCPYCGIKINKSGK